MLTTSICAALVLGILTIAAKQPQKVEWRDDGNYQRVYLHTTRVASDAERLAMWKAKAHLYQEHGAIRI